MASHKATNNSDDLTEDELSDLLDSALSDFCKNQETVGQNVTPSPSSQAGGATKPTSAVDESSSKLNKENASFKLFESDPELKECWSKLVKSCNEPVENDDNDFRDSLHNTLKIISEKAKDIAGDEHLLSEDDIAKTLANLAELNGDPENNDSDGNSELNRIMPLMSNIMENLLSKDFLYPTLSDLSQKYPDYLNEYKNKISREDYERYEKQFKIIGEICSEFESEHETESSEAKNVRFNRILTLMQTMQTYGTPPPSLVSPSAINPDTLGDLNMFGQMDDTKCSLM